jgi:UDP-N-acetylglucosamine/UDP-N-acetylgalactosamine diphosphorylase
MSEFDTLLSTLKHLGQDHICHDLENFSDTHPVYQQLKSLNLERSVGHFKTANMSEVDKKHDKYLPVRKVLNLNELEEDLYYSYNDVGMQAIAEGKVAAIIMSGGQGTRLGFEGPKGMYNLGLPSKKSIFQIHIEKILKIKELARVRIGLASSSVPIYIMTSNLNHKIIMDYFKNNSFFGYPEADIVFFEQGVEPSFTFEGKIIIESSESLSLAPDGNGGIYRALGYSGCYDDMKRRGVEHLHVYGIDNVLTKALDPLFIGGCIAQNVQCGNKVVWRAHKTEKVGVTTERDGRMHILEYSELPPDLADSEDPVTGKLIFGAANICNHYLSVAFVVDTIMPSLSEVYHVAKKKIPYMDATSKHTVSPSEVNGVKLELFIFDVFPLAERWVVMEGLREDEFAPVKNAPGSSQVRCLFLFHIFVEDVDVVLCFHCHFSIIIDCLFLYSYLGFS